MTTNEMKKESRFDEAVKAYLRGEPNSPVKHEELTPEQVHENIERYENMTTLYEHDGKYYTKLAGSAGKAYSYWADKGEFKVGDLLLDRNNMSYAEVVEVDTKSKLASKRFSGWKVNATKIKD